MKRKELSIALALAIISAGSSVYAAEVVDFGDEDVVVTANRIEEKVMSVPANVTVITGEDIRKQNIFSLRDALAKEVGIYVSPTAETKDGLSIRGLYSKDILVMYNGQELNSAFDGTVNWDSISMENIKKVEIVRGAGSSLYGGHAVAGVVNIITNDTEDNDIHVRTNLSVGSNSTWKRGIAISGGVDKVHFDIGYDKRTTGGYPGYYRIKYPGAAGTAIAVNNLPQLSDGGYVIGSRGRKSKINENINLNLNYKFTDSKELRYTYAHHDYKYDYNDPFSYLHDATGKSIYNGTIETQNGDFIKASYSDFLGYHGERGQDIHRLTYEDKANTFKVGIGYSNLYKEGYSSASGVKSIDWSGSGSKTEYPSKNTNLDIQKSWIINNNTIVAGLGWSKNSMDYVSWKLTNWRDWSTTTTKGNTAGGNILNTALFIQDEIKLDSRWKTYLGLRYDKFDKKDGYSIVNNVRKDYSDSSYSNISPKVAVSYEPTDKLTLFASYGGSFNPPSIYKLFRRAGDAMSSVQANPDLKPEMSKTFELGAKYQPTDKTSLGLTLFRISTDDKIALDTRNGVKAYYNMDSGMQKGIELELKHSFDAQWRGYFNYTFESGELTSDGVSKRNWNIPKHLIHFGLANDLGKLSANLDFQYISARQSVNAVTGEYGSEDAFFTANLSFNYNFNKNFSAQFSINNLFDRKYYASEATDGRNYMFGLNASF
ncbi:MAG: TonB-dependent receptor [Anaerovibrio sp.]|uniref:TonB-dependent receptor n=1 Tax=Anaerovibrio sp. TaxID=1872532 RepID=UPI0025CDF044|nr:TonB-dependent receptor [Anaerovibrio sp.]MCR5177087.1 TonB-dependent receptor [Anaerovibrio sp.]